jgi:enoyl-CoA hydratase/carnithine racemase
MFVPTTIVELGALMTDLEADPSVKVVVFQSANPGFFIAHLDVAKAAERPETLGLWRDFVLRLSSTAVVSIAKIREGTAGSWISLIRLYVLLCQATATTTASGSAFQLLGADAMPC